MMFAGPWRILGEQSAARIGEPAGECPDVVLELGRVEDLEVEAVECHEEGDLVK